MQQLDPEQVATHGMPLMSVVQVRQGSIRSISIELDIGREDLVGDYVLTAQSRRSLERIVSGTEISPPSRAWTLTGQYGTGKSYFGLGLSHLACKELAGHDYAHAQLERADPQLALRTAAAFCPPGTKGMFTLPVTGYRAPLHECVRQGLEKALIGLKGEIEGSPLTVNELAGPGDVSSRTVVRALESFAEALIEPTVGYGGLLIILDEMGKPLEYVSAHPDSADIYFLQEVAEAANRSTSAPIIFVGILHQGFDRYAGHLDSLAQREWAKVQGRFEDIPFQEPPTQMLRLLANAIEQDAGALAEGLLAKARTYATEAAASGWLPPHMTDEEYVDICRRAYPLHPTAATALPYLFRRLAQNERSLFAYLVSMEPKGFQEFLQSRVVGEFIRIPDLFDYLISNYQVRLYASMRARSLTETLERLQGSTELDALATELLKAIGMLSWLAENSPTKATKRSLVCALEDETRTETDILAALERLQKKSLVTYRRFNDTYAVWQGSDVDIEGRIEEAQRKLAGQFSLAQAVALYVPPQPVVAKRHSYETGTVRYFELRYVDEVTRERVSLNPSSGASGLVLLSLSASHVDTEAAAQWATMPRMQGERHVVIGIVERSVRLAELMGELRSLRWVQDNTPELHDDPVARRELRTRVAELESMVRNELENTLRLHRLPDGANCRWFTGGQEITWRAQRGLSNLLSGVCDDLYRASPRIWNEILNRRALSSQGAAARRNLIEGMIRKPHLAILGIEGYPPERSMYGAVLFKGGLHVEREPGVWDLEAPTAPDPLNLGPTWQAIADYVFAEPPEPRSVRQLFDSLNAPPYGGTDGALPVLLCAFVLVNSAEVTLYREGTLLPEPEVADWELLLRRPELFAIAGCRVAGPRAAVVERLAAGLGTAAAALPVVRELLRRLRSLPEYATRTQRLSAEALAARKAFGQAHSPERLLFHDLPTALGLASFGDEDTEREQVNEFFDRLNHALQELAWSTPSLVSKARDELLEACGLPKGQAGWEQFRAVATEMAPSVVHPGLGPLLKRAADEGTPQAILESTLAYVANRPPKSWTDADADRFSTQAHVLGKLFQSQRNGYGSSPELSDEQRARSMEVAERLRAFIDEQCDDPLVAQAALRALLNDIATRHPVNVFLEVAQ